MRRGAEALPALVLGALVAVWAWSCGDGGSSGPSTAEPVDPGVDSCVLCSMVVREQPAPRAQILHRDGFRVFLCAVSELEPYLAAPSSHGKPAAIWVEVLSEGSNGSEVSSAPHPWKDATGAAYVVDGPQRPVMGAPVLTYTTEAGAARVAESVGGRTLDWNELLIYLGS